MARRWSVTQPDEAWNVLERLGGAWVIQIRKIEPAWDMLCVCLETQAVFRVQGAGDIDFRSSAEGKRLVDFYPVTGDDHVEPGFHMVPQQGTSPRPSPDEAPIDQEKLKSYEHMWTTHKDDFALMAVPTEKGTYPDGSTMYSISKRPRSPEQIIGRSVSIADPAIAKEVARRMLAAGVLLQDVDTVFAAITEHWFKDSKA